MEGETGIVEGHVCVCVCVNRLTYRWGGRDRLSMGSEIWEVCVCVCEGGDAVWFLVYVCGENGFCACVWKLGCVCVFVYVSRYGVCV